MGNITINAKGQKVNRDGLTFEEFAKKKLAEKNAKKTSSIGSLTKNASGQTVNRDGLTFEEFATLKIYERDKKAGKITQNYNAGQINSGLSRDAFDSKVRGGSAQKKTAAKTVSISLPNSDRSSLERTITKKIELPEKKEYYSMPEELTNNAVTEATGQKMNNAEKVYNIYGKLISSTGAKIKWHDTRLSELEKELNSLGADYEASPSAAKASAYNAKYEELVAIQNERNSLAEKYNSYISETKDVGQLYSSYASEFTAQNKERLEVYKDWRSTVRESGTVENDISAIDKALKELQSAITSKRMDDAYEEELGHFTDDREKEIEELQNQLVSLQNKKAILEEEFEAAKDIEFAEYYASYTERDDFTEKSKYRSTHTGKGATLNVITGEYLDLGYDVVYEYVNDTEGVRSTVNGLSKETLSYIAHIGEIKQLATLTDDEKKLYNYLYATEGAKSALKFLNGLESELNMRYTKNEQTEYSEYADKHPWGASLFSLFLGLSKPNAYINQIFDYIDDGKIDQYALYNLPAHQSKEIRETVSSKFGAVGSFAYNIGMSMADNLLSIAVTGGDKAFVLSILGTSAAADSTIAAKERGLSDSQAIALGTLTGAAEIITEKISLDELLDGIGKGRSAVMYILRNATAEGGEEALSEVLTTLADVMVAGDESEWRKQIKAYMDEGYSEGEAFAKVLGNKVGDTSLSALGGFLSGGTMGGMFLAPSAISHTVKKIDYKKTVGKLLEGKIDAQEKLVADALKFSKDSEGYKLAEKIDSELKAGKTPKTSDLVKLEEYWELVDDTPKIVADLAKEGKTLDDVKKHFRNLGISGKVVTDAMIEEAYNKTSKSDAENTTKEENVSASEEKSDQIDVKYSFSDINEENSHKQFADVAELISEITDEGAKRRNSQRPYVLVSKNTPQILKDSGANDLPVIMRFDAMYLAERTDGVYPKESYHYHGLGKEVISKLPQHISNPDLVLETKGKNGKTRLIEIMSIPTKSGEMLVSVELDTVKDIGSENTPYNVVLTAFDIKQKYFNQLFKKQNATVKYQKEALTQVNPQLHEWLSTVNASASTNSIPQNGGNVNPDADNSSAEDLDAPYESEITEHKREIGETNRVYEHNDPAMDRFYADLYNFQQDLKAKGQLDGHKIRKVPTDTERSGIIYGASQADIDTAVRLSKALGRKIMFFSEQSRNGRIKNGTLDRDIIWINVQRQAGKTVEWVIAHELTHTIEDTRAYGRLKDYVWRKLGNEKIEDQRKELKQTYDAKEVDFEIVCNYVADNLLTSEKAITDLVRHNRTLGEKVRSIIKKIGAKLKNAKAKEALDIDNMLNLYKRAFAEQSGIEQNTDGYESEFDRKKAADPDDILNDRYIKSLREQFSNGEISKDELDTLVEEYVDKLEEGDSSAAGTDKVRNSIVNLDDGKVYVQASRNVIKGETLSERRKDITQFFSDLLDERSSLDIPTIDGDVLTITKEETANKARDNYKLVEGERVKLTDEEFLVKLHVEAHIDEIAETSTPTSQKTDKKNHYFADDGFTYRKAYFRDFDGKYYEVTLSIGHNGTIATVYNVGKIKEGISPSAKIIAVVGSKPLGKTPSGNIIPDSRRKVNTSEENIFPFSEDAQNSYSSMKDLSDKVRKEYDDILNDRYIKSLREQFENGEISKDEFDTLVEEYVDKLEEGDSSAEVTDRVRNSYSKVKAPTPGEVRKDLLDKYNTASYNKRGWAYVNSVLYGRMSADFSSKLGELKHGIFHNRLPDGNYIIPTGAVEGIDNVLIFTNGNFGNPSIDRVVKINLDNETDIGPRRKDFIDFLKEGYDYDDIVEFSKDYAGQRIFSNYTLRDFKTLRQLREQAGSTPKSYLYSGELENGGRSTQESEGNDYLTDPFPFSEDAQNSYSSMKDLSDKVRKEYDAVTKDMNPKGREYLASAERAFVHRLAEIFSLPTEAKRGLAKDIAKSVILEQLKNGAVTAEFANDIFEKAFDAGVMETSLYEAYGENPDVYEWLRNDFNELIGEFTKNIDYGKNYVEEVARRMAEEELVIPSAESLFETYKQIKSLRAIAAKAVAKNVLLPIEESLVKDLLTGRITLEQIPADTYNVEAIKEVYEAKLPYEYAMRVINAYHNHRKSTQYERADSLLEDFKSWKKHTSGLSLSINTMERNFRALCEGDPQRAEELIKEYITPVHSHEALSTKYKNKFLDEIRELKISQKKAKGNRDSEAAAVQFMGEAKSHIERLEAKPRLDRSGGLTLEEWQKALSDFETANPDLDYKKIDNCIRTFRKIYNQLFDDMNKARMLNGYEPIDYRYAYFPHFQKDKVSWARELFLPQKQVDNLPATIAGLTENFKPGIRWLSQAQRRSMSDTEYDCLEGFDRYIDGAADVIFHTEDIQKLRSLANRIRYQASDEAIKKRIEAIEADETLTDEEKHERIAEEAASKFTLASFVNEVDEYTNILAGKKSRADRQMEQDLGREFYNYSTWLKRRFGANMIAGNLGSAFTNLIPLVQTAGITRGTLLKAMYEEIRSIANDDGFTNRSVFLTNRYGSDRLSGKAIEKISDAFGLPMNFIDHFSSGAIVRALYKQALIDGLSEAEAMEQADARAADIMADRSKGAMPTIFARANFSTAILTQFQLEVANQYSYLFKDLPRYFGGSDKKAKKVVGALFKIFILSYLFNDVYEAIVGRRSALDPFDVINDTVGDVTGYKLPNMFDAIDDAIHGEFGADTFKTQKEGVGKGVWNLATESAAELPFVGSFVTSLFGADGGRIPIGSALPDVQSLINTFSSDSTNGKKIEKLITELTKPASNLLLPFGGSQIKKTVQGAVTWAKGGAWTEDNEGRDKLKFPIKNVGEGIQSVMFGQYASRSGREWIENGFDTMYANQTADYKTFLSAGYSKDKAFDKARELYEYSNPKYFSKFIDEGVNADTSFELTKKICESEDANGKDETLTRTQKAEIIVSTVQDKGERLSALKAVLTEKEYAKFELAQNSFGVPAVHYVTAKTKIAKLKEEGGYKSTSQEVVKIVLDEMDLYDGQKAALWQLIGGWKPESNPYNVKRGKEVYEALEKINE